MNIRKRLSPIPSASNKNGTIFDGWSIGLDKSLAAMPLIASYKNGVSSYENPPTIKVTQKTTWFMMHGNLPRNGTRLFQKLSGMIEAGKTFVGGKARNMHVAKRQLRATGGSGNGKKLTGETDCASTDHDSRDRQE